MANDQEYNTAMSQSTPSAGKIKIPNIIDRFGRSTADRLEILREAERRAPKKLRDAIASGPVLNYEAGICWPGDEG